MSLDASSTAGRGLRTLLAVLIVSLNLRGAVTCVGPLLEFIQEEFALSSTAAGLLSSLPLFAFGFISPYAAPLARKLGMELAILVALVLLLVGLGLRYLPGAPLLYLGTALIGIGIAINNVLLPGLLRRDFHHQLATVTAMFTAVLVSVGGLGSGLAVPLYEIGGWRFSLVAWAIPALLGVLVWLPELRHNTKSDPSPAPAVKKVSLWRDKLAWQVSLFMGLQSSAFYVMIAWFTSLISDLEGLDAARAGWILFVYQIFILISVMAVPLFVRALKDQRWIGVGCAAFILAGYLGVYLAPGQSMVWMSVMGLGAGGSLVLAITLFGLRTTNAAQTVGLSGMAQAVGYSMAAVMPIIIGLLHDLSGGWDVPLLLMLALSVVQVVSGYLSGLPRTVGQH